MSRYRVPLLLLVTLAAISGLFVAEGCHRRQRIDAMRARLKVLSDARVADAAREAEEKGLPGMGHVFIGRHPPSDEMLAILAEIRRLEGDGR